MLFSFPVCSSPMSWVPISATILLPCGFGYGASLLLGKLEGLDHRAIYMGGPLKTHNELRLADTVIDLIGRVISQ